ncbi:hypothetical protein ZWY2020_016978, partial [Hordeum vulgare]
ASLIVREALADFKLAASTSAGNHRPDRHHDAAPRQGCLGPGRRRVPAGPVRERRRGGICASRRTCTCRSGTGPGFAQGQNLAMVELKVVLVRLLSKFAFSPSPGYRHAPLFRLTIEPGFAHASGRHWGKLP